MSSREGRCPFRMRRGIRYVKMRLGKGKYSVSQWVAESDEGEHTLGYCEPQCDSGKKRGLVPVQTFGGIMSVMAD